jgi:RecB family endonuclease NucS
LGSCPHYRHALARTQRLLVKQDGSPCVHTDRGFKPLNYNLTKARGG